MRALEPENRVRVGIMALVLVLLVTGVGQSFTSVPMLFAQPRYYGEFGDAGALRAGDKVRIAGMEVGSVQELSLATGHVVVRFTLEGNAIGSQSRLSIRTDTILGKKVLEVEPRGDDTLRPGATIPLSQTTTPYQIYDAFRDATKDAAGWDVDTIKQSLQVLTDTVDQTAPHLSAALDGVQRFADTVSRRDDQIQHLLGETSKVAGVLGIHGEQINRLLVNAQALLSAINARGQAVQALLGNVRSVAGQVQGLITDNPNLNAVLKQVNTVSDVLVKRKDDLVDTVAELGKFVASLSEIVASGPYVKAAIFNLLPYQILQPWVDAAFKKRGINPEKFWGDAGLPSFRYPDPNGQRLPNGAPPPAPIPLEGTPEHPGPAVVAGSPCSYAPAPGDYPAPGNPLPCANTDAGPFGDNPFSSAVNLPGVVGAPANPIAPPAAPGVPSAALPGELPPPVEGVPAPPLAPGPPGARTVPVAPVMGPSVLPDETGGN
ncbi:Mce family protein Mce1C [Mycobacterium antarcticum]|uniref:MCE family protein n=1 Tax=unclassified Mycolicibacterium TaxID=2636767 RepID=UPI00239985A4|nr:MULTISPECIES: MCE family protein [unclassified Mycolicibacterium]BDX33769.1 Mce family protein Mce1C [Mycolicibacterium sp. TUM20985]GLP76936.1 Mce family protein Mce1C [Mycolicibacterium sp. TUM20983]